MDPRTNMVRDTYRRYWKHIRLRGKVGAADFNFNRLITRDLYASAVLAVEILSVHQSVQGA